MHQQLLVDNEMLCALELTNGRAVLGSVEQQEVVSLLCVKRTERAYIAGATVSE
jgi:hypothetical protein